MNFARVLVTVALGCGLRITGLAAQQVPHPPMPGAPVLNAQAEAPAETPDALPAGPGQEATFYTCTACHDTALIRRSRLSRERWDELMDWMTERHGMPPLEGAARVEIVDYLAAHFRPQRRSGGNPFLAPPAE